MENLALKAVESSTEDSRIKINTFADKKESNGRRRMGVLSCLYGSSCH